MQSSGAVKWPVQLTAFIYLFLCDVSVDLGPKAPTARRDMTLPYWWTINHDLLLLQLVAVDSLPSTKRASFKHLFPASSTDAAPAEVTEEDEDVADDEDPNQAKTGSQAAKSKSREELLGTNWNAVVSNLTVSKQWPTMPVSNPGMYEKLMSCCASTLAGTLTGLCCHRQ
jgi:hypothetical protein